MGTLASHRSHVGTVAASGPLGSGGDRLAYWEALWRAYAAAWEDGVSLPISLEHLPMFAWGGLAGEAVQLAAKCPPAHDNLRKTAATALDNLGFDGLPFAVMGAVLQPSEIVRAWQRSRGARSAQKRTSLAQNVTGELVGWMGRDWMRENVLTWWADADLLEEERETILDVLEERHVLTETLIASLGPLAQRRGRTRGMAPGVPLLIAGSTPEVGTAIGSLLNVIRLPSDLRDAGFSPQERDRCQATLSGWSSSFFEKTLQELRHHSRFWHELAHAVEEAGRNGLPLPSFALPGSQLGQGGTAFAVPLVRLLHMRLVLEAPALAGALANPHDHLAPAVLLHVLGHDAVTYIPEVRLHQGVERRWRARWAEMSGEAIAALVLEDALRVDLTTLTRIPERPDRETPDFMAATREGEEIVFESKGATDFATHRQQRRKALAQLGKIAGRTSRRRSLDHRPRNARAVPWKGSGRAFACCFFAATQGARASSGIHVADPPFGFHDLFHEGWTTAARRTHYGAVAEAAGLFELADDLLQRQVLGERPQRADVESFSFGLGDNQVARGTSTLLEDAARRLRHPRRQMFERVRMFVGIVAERFDVLARGELPGPLDSDEVRLMAGSGALPAKGTAPAARGVYSLLSDGSFLAFEVD